MQVKVGGGDGCGGGAEEDREEEATGEGVWQTWREEPQQAGSGEEESDSGEEGESDSGEEEESDSGGEGESDSGGEGEAVVAAVRGEDVAAGDCKVVCAREKEEKEEEEEEEEEEEGECEVVEVEKAPSPQFKVGSQYRTLCRQLQQIEVSRDWQCLTHCPSLSLSLSLSLSQYLLKTSAHKLADGGAQLRDQRQMVMRKMSGIKRAPPPNLLISPQATGLAASGGDKVT